MNKQQKTNEPIWKRRFIILILTNLAIIVILAIFLYTPIDEKKFELSSEQYKQERSSEFVIRTTKENVNNLVNAYLDKLLAQTSHQYSIHLDEDVQLFGELPVFSTTV